MTPTMIPRQIDDPIILVRWNADELVPMVLMLMIGMLINHLIIMIALSFIVIKYYKKFRDTRPDGYSLHAAYWLGLMPSQAFSVPNPYIREFFQ